MTVFDIQQKIIKNCSNPRLVKIMMVVDPQSWQMY